MHIIVSLETSKKAKTNITTGKIKGFDFGLKTFLRVSNKDKKISPYFYKKSQNKIKKNK